MRSALFLLCATAIVAASAMLVGCGSDATQTPTNTVAGSPPPLPPGGEDEHAGHGDHAGHAHPTEGPHGGHLIELGNEEYYAELLHDDGAHTVTIHLLDAAGKQPVAVAEPEIALQLFQGGEFVNYALKAVPEQGDAPGAASRFEIADADLCDALCHEEEVRGRLQVTIDGTPFTGAIEHGAQCDHDHDDHGDDDHGHEGHDHDGDDHDAHDHDGHDEDGHDHGDHEGHDHS